MQAGMYNMRFEWLQQSETKNTTYGQDVESFTSVGYLWGYVEEQNASQGVNWGVTESQAFVYIHIRNIVPLSTKDRLREKEYGDYYEIEGVTRDKAKNETYVTATRRRIP